MASNSSAAAPPQDAVGVLIAHQEGDVLTLTLNRPQVRNALNVPLIAQLTAQFEGPQTGVRTIVLQGSGASFCAGADLSWMRAVPGQDGAAVRPGGHDSALMLQRLFLAMARAPQVVVVVAQGPVRGGGVGLLCAADVVLAGTSLTLAFPEASLGLVPAVIAPFVVERLGLARARYLFLTSEVVAAAQAQSLGAVHDIVPDAQLPERLQHILARLHHNGPGALAATKRLLFEIGSLPDTQVHALCASTLDEVRKTAEAQEGCAAFLQRRAPTWRPA